MEKIQITKNDFMKRFAASRKRKQELLESLQKEIQKEHVALTGCEATNIFVM